MKVKKIGLSSITVSDINKALKFYKDIMGLSVTNSEEEYQWYELAGDDGNTLLGLGQAKPEYGFMPGKNAILSFVVDNINEAKKELETKGIKFLSDIMDIKGEVKLVLFEDYDGNKLYLVEELK